MYSYTGEELTETREVVNRSPLMVKQEHGKCRVNPPEEVASDQRAIQLATPTGLASLTHTQYQQQMVLVRNANTIMGGLCVGVADTSGSSGCSTISIGSEIRCGSA